MTGVDVDAFAHCLGDGGVAVFPADTVYGLACDPHSADAVHRLYALKGRPAAKPAAIMFFGLDDALAALPELGVHTTRALRHLLPGGVTVLLPNPAGRFPLAGGPGRAALGLRVPRLTGALSALAELRRPVLQSSANRAGGADPRCVEEVPQALRRGVDLVLDAGELPGTPSTVVDLCGYEHGSAWSVLREGAVSAAAVAAALQTAGAARGRC